MVVAGAMGGQMAVMSSGLLELQVTWVHLPFACSIVTRLSAAMKRLSHRASLQQGKVPNLLHMTEIKPESTVRLRLWNTLQAQYNISITVPLTHSSIQNNIKCTTVLYNNTQAHIEPFLLLCVSVFCLQLYPTLWTISLLFHLLSKASEADITVVPRYKRSKVVCVCFKSMSFDPEFSVLFPTITQAQCWQLPVMGLQNTPLPHQLIAC